jgi:hypothetical protein
MIGCATRLALDFLNCNGYLQHMVFLWHKSIKQVVVVAFDSPISYMVPYIVKYTCNSNAIAIHINFLHKCRWMNAMLT